MFKRKKQIRSKIKKDASSRRRCHMLFLSQQSRISQDGRMVVTEDYTFDKKKPHCLSDRKKWAMWGFNTQCCSPETQGGTLEYSQYSR